jgi:hypothetical protein
MSSNRRKSEDLAPYLVLTYRLGRSPDTKRMAPHNLASWTIIESILSKSQHVHFSKLAAATREHVSGDLGKPGSINFIKYCIRRGWLQNTEG